MCCDNCLTDFASCNLDSITINSKLEPNKDYTCYLTDRFNKTRIVNFTTDGDGKWTLNKSDFPDGFFAPGNHFSIQVKDRITGNPVPILMMQPYDCVKIELKDTGEETKDFIGSHFITIVP